MGILLFFGSAIGYVFVAARGPAWALAGAAALLPYQRYIPNALPLLNITNIITLGVLWATFFASERPPAPRRAFSPALPLFALVLIFGYVNTKMRQPDILQMYPWFSSYANSIDFKTALTDLLLVYCGYRVARRVEDARIIFLGALVGFGAENLFCFLEMFRHGTNVTGHMGHKNLSGAFLAIHAAIGLTAFLSWPKGRIRWILLTVGLTGAIAALGTNSRGGIISLGASVLFISFLRSRVAFVLLLVLISTWSYWMPDDLVARFEESVEVSEEGEIEAADTFEDRILIWTAGMRSLPDFPMGAGFGLFAYTVPDYGLREVFQYPVKNAHNQYVKYLVELSIPGAAAFVWLLLAMAYGCWRAYRQATDPETRGMALGVLAGLLGAMGAGLVGTSMMRLNVVGITWLLTGVMGRVALEQRLARQQARGR